MLVLNNGNDLLSVFIPLYNRSLSFSADIGIYNYSQKKITLLWFFCRKLISPNWKRQISRFRTKDVVLKGTIHVFRENLTQADLYKQTVGSSPNWRLNRAWTERILEDPCAIDIFIMQIPRVCQASISVYLFCFIHFTLTCSHAYNSRKVEKT